MTLHTIDVHDPYDHSCVAQYRRRATTITLLHILTWNHLFFLVALFLLIVLFLLLLLLLLLFLLNLLIYLNALVLLQTLSFINIQFYPITFVVFLSALVAIINESGVCLLPFLFSCICSKSLLIATGPTCCTIAAIFGRI